jgi:4-hydroxybenzoate polyprenyltransferase
VYDTIYACQDKSDDVQVGIKSTAIRFGNDVKKWLSGFAILTVSGFAVAGYLNDQGLGYYIVGVFGSASHFFWQIKTWNPLSTIDCWSKFKSNRTIGLLIASGILIDILTK